MRSDFAGSYNSYSDFYDSQDGFAGNESDHSYDEDAQRREKVSFTLCTSMPKYVKTSLELSVIFGVIFGLVAIFLWWIELNVKPYCLTEWDAIPTRTHRLILMVESVKVIIIMFWPLLTIAPICSRSMIKETNILHYCAIAGFLDVTDRLCMFIIGHYQQKWKSYVGNGIFAVLSFIVFYKFAKQRQKLSKNNENTILITVKLSMQLIAGLMIFLPYNYLLLQFYSDSTPLVRTILSCTLIAVFYIPKLIICNLIIHQHGIYSPNECIVFSAAFLIISTMVARLTQARIESLSYFTVVCVVHGVFNVIDKIALPIREKICNIVCRKRSYSNDRNEFFTHLSAHQSLINMVTETASVIMSNAAAYLLRYYYEKEQSTGKRYDGRTLFKEMLIRSSIAVCIEWICNVVALKLQNDSYNIPVMQLWKSHWKFILIIHLIQILYVVLYFAYHVDYMLLSDVMQHSSQNCTGAFKRL